MRISDWSSDVCSSDLRQDGNGHDDDADAAEPLQDGAPQQDAGGRVVQSADHRGAGGGDARHRLEEGADRIEVELRKLERQRAEDDDDRSEEHPSETQSHTRTSYPILRLKNTKTSSTAM